jgi:hypothetical protein
MNTTESKLANIANNVINTNPDENRKSDKLMAHLKKDFGHEINLGRAEKRQSTELSVLLTTT